ncbi:uncharacterized [Tachysurus ichikawai]
MRGRIQATLSLCTQVTTLTSLIKAPLPASPSWPSLVGSAVLYKWLLRLCPSVPGMYYCELQCVQCVSMAVKQRFTAPLNRQTVGLLPALIKLPSRGEQH